MRIAFLISILLWTKSSVSFAMSEQCRDVGQQAKVSAVYPTADSLPENLLRFYVYFNQPMNTENSLSHIYLSDENGQRLEGVFLANKINLWTPDRTRLTLLFDPGRVKTGLVAHHKLGRALKPGMSYTLVVDAGAINQDICGSVYRKTFTAIEENTEKPSINTWQVNAPQMHTKQPLTIGFNAPIDHTSLAFRLRVKNSEDTTIAGFIDIGFQERQWIFTPESAWSNDESYTLLVDPVFEDIVGNRLTGLFDQPSLIEETKNENNQFELPIELAK